MAGEIQPKVRCPTIFTTLMPILHKAADEVNVFGLDNVDEKRVQDTYNELLIAQMTIYTELIKPYVDHINVLEQKKITPPYLLD